MSKEERAKASARKRGLKELLGGVAVAAVGGIATAVSYNVAKPGGTYTVYTGIIALGVVYAIKGLIDLAFPKGFKKSDKNSSISESSAAAEATAEAEVVKEED